MSRSPVDAVPVSSCSQSILVLVFHAFTSSPARMEPIRKAVEEQLPSAHILVPALPFGLTSLANPLHVARQMVALVDAQVAFREAQQWPSFQQMILIGHSLGAVLARKVYLLAGPESAEARFDDSTRDSSLGALLAFALRACRLYRFYARHPEFAGWMHWSAGVPYSALVVVLYLLLLSVIVRKA